MTLSPRNARKGVYTGFALFIGESNADCQRVRKDTLHWTGYG